MLVYGNFLSLYYVVIKKIALVLQVRVSKILSKYTKKGKKMLGRKRFLKSNLLLPIITKKGEEQGNY